jgi:hypothetical protein
LLTSECKQVFILGAPRSGTTFLASLLKLTRFGVPFETQFVVKYYHLLTKYGNLADKENFKLLVSDILSERAVMQWKLTLDLDQFFSLLTGRWTYSNIIDELCLLRNSQLDLQAWGDKTPHYIGDFEVIYKLFPNAKFIYIVRDGRDVALSLLEKNWGPNNIYTCARYWKRLNKEQPLFERLKEQGQFISVIYEELLDSPEDHVRKIYDFLGEKIDDKKIIGFARTVKSANYQKWKVKLNKGQLQLFDNVSGDTLARFGYESSCSESEINGIKRVLYMFHDKFMHYHFLFHHNIIDGFKIRFLNKDPFND